MRKRGSILCLSPLAASLLALCPLALDARAEGEPASPAAGSAKRELLLRLESRSLGGDWQTCEVSRDGALRFEDSWNGEGAARLGPAALARLEQGLLACGLCRLAARSGSRRGRSKRWVSMELRGSLGTGCAFKLTREAWKRYGGKCAARITEALEQARPQCSWCHWP